MSIGELVDAEVSSADSVRELVENNVSLNQRRGMIIKIIVQGSGKPMMVLYQSPRVVNPEEMKDIFDGLEEHLSYHAMIEGVDIEESSVKTLVKLVPESGKIDYEEDYSPNYRIPFTHSDCKVQVFLDNPTSKRYF